MLIRGAQNKDIMLIVDAGGGTTASSYLSSLLKASDDTQDVALLRVERPAGEKPYLKALDEVHGRVISRLSNPNTNSGRL
jgi:hypothetical protein